MTITIEKCCCGSEFCQDYWLVGIGKFMQGSGFTKDEAQRIANFLNSTDKMTIPKPAETALVEALKWLNNFRPDRIAQVYNTRNVDGYVDAIEAAIARAETAEAQLAEAKGEVERQAKALDACMAGGAAVRQRLAVIELEGLRQMEGWINANKTIATLTAQRDRLLEAGKPFKQMAEVLEARALMTFGRTVPDNERVLLSSGEVGTAVINMGQFRALRKAHDGVEGEG